MGRPYVKTYRVCAGIICLLALLGIALQYYTAIPFFLAQGRTMGGAIVEFFSFFTIQCNLLVVITLFVIAITPIRVDRFFNRPDVVTAIAVYISIVGFVYNLMLSQMANFKGAAKLADELLHLIIPALFVIYWLTTIPKDQINWKHTLGWMRYPAFYLCYILTRGLLTGLYPYYFLDIGKYGFLKITVNIAALMLVFFGFSILYVGMARLINRTNKSL